MFPLHSRKNTNRYLKRVRFRALLQLQTSWQPSHLTIAFFCCCSLPIFLSWITPRFTHTRVLFRCFTKTQGTPSLPWHGEQEDKQVQVAFHGSFHNNYEAIQEFVAQSKETEIRCMNKQGKRAAGKDKCVSFPFSKGDFFYAPSHHYAEYCKQQNLVSSQVGYIFQRFFSLTELIYTLTQDKELVRQQKLQPSYTKWLSTNSKIPSALHKGLPS